MEFWCHLHHFQCFKFPSPARVNLQEIHLKPIGKKETGREDTIDIICFPYVRNRQNQQQNQGFCHCDPGYLWLLMVTYGYLWLPHNWGAPFMCKPGIKKRNTSMMLVCIFPVEEGMESTLAAVEFYGHQLQKWVEICGQNREAKIVWKDRTSVFR